MRIARIVLLITAVLAGFLVVQAPVAAAGAPTTLVVDDDRAQCPRADYADIKSAIDAARPGATVKVCSGSYDGDLAIDKPVNLMAQNPAGPAVDCRGRGAIGAGASMIDGTVSVTGSGAMFDGFVVSGADTGIITSDEGSGYQLRRNVIEGNGNFGIDLRSAGGQTSTVERNCIRGNDVNGNQGWRVGIIGDFGVLRDTVIRNNTFADSGEAISIAGSFGYSNISITKNAVGRGTIVMAGTTASEITRNDIDITGATPPRHGIFLGGENTGLVISSNDIVAAAGAGIYFCSVCTDDPHPNPNVGLLITANTIRDDLGGGISMAAQGGLQVTRSVMYRNTIQHNGGSGIVLNQGSVGNLLLGNTSTGNARGIFLNGATGMVVLRNTITGNTLDAWDTIPEQNQWIANRCVTDDPAGALCGRPSTAAQALPGYDVSRSSTTAGSLPARPNADLSQWPCIRVPVWDVAADGGAWNWATLDAADAEPRTVCGEWPQEPARS